MMLVEAAARQWGVPAADCVAENATVRHAASGRTLGYGALATAAAQLPVPQSPTLKPASAYKVVGKSTPRVDTPAKVTGAATFGIDVRVPGLRYALVAACPVFGGTVASIDDAAALKVPGVQPGGAHRGCASPWSPGTAGPPARVWPRCASAGMRARTPSSTTADLVAELDAALDRPGLVATNTGDVRGGRGQGRQPLPGGFPPADPRPRRAGAA